MNIILFGPPGAGKGTQSDKIVDRYKLFKISSGDLLREEVKKDNQLSKQIKFLLDKGSFVSDETIDVIVNNILLDNKKNKNLIFDGYPRNISQATKLDILIKKLGLKISCVLSLEVDKETIIKRISGRQTCSNCGLIFNEYFNPATSNNHKCDKNFLQKRSDDNEKTITQRYETYLKTTLPVLNFYKKQNILHEINGKGEIGEIYKQICEIITPLEAWLYKLSLYK